MPIEIDIRTNVKEIEKKLSALAYKQVPFATVLALTALARDVKIAERHQFDAVLNNPRAFTLNSLVAVSARKDALMARVFVKDAQAKYLAPEDEQSEQVLGKGKRIRTPVDVATDTSGDIPKGRIKALLSRPDTFLGTVRGVNGIWQRPSKPKQGKRAGKATALANTTGHLRLLIAFTRPVRVKTRLEFRQVAERTVASQFNRRFGAALAYAVRSAR
jgi:hypothetical protein